MIDLHLHSTFSDGTLPPAELLQEAARLQLEAIALTDHDTLEGIPEFLAAAAAMPPGSPQAIPGIELACSLEEYGEIHIVGLYLQNLEPLETILASVRRWRMQRNRQMIRNLQNAGLPITEEDVLQAQDNSRGTLGRPHMAKVLVEKSICKNAQDAFDRYLRRNKPGYAERKKLTAAQGIAAIHAAGGIAVWAHPMTRHVSNLKVEVLLAQLKDEGLDAVEAYYPDHTRGNTVLLQELASHLDLAVSGGSDFHGGMAHEKIHMGTGYGGNWQIPGRLLPALEKRIPHTPFPPPPHLEDHPTPEPNMNTPAQPYLFLDRDDTLIYDVPYLSDPRLIHLTPCAATALKQLQSAGYRLVVISNQSGIGRGLITPAQYKAVEQRLSQILQEEGVTLDATFICPHAPQEKCHCRKPETGLLEQACRKFSVDRSRSIMIGDKPADIELGRRFGLKTVQIALPEKHREDLQADAKGPDLLSVTPWLLQQLQP